MAERKRPVQMGYGANGSAAYDIRRQGNAAPELPLPRPQLPQEKKIPQKTVTVRGKIAVSPFAMVGSTVCALMLMLTIFGYVQLYEATTQVRTLEAQLQTQAGIHESLLAEYESKIDLTAIEARATTELGLMQPALGQTIQVNLAGEDRAEILETTKKGPVSEIFGAIKTSIEGLVAYLS